MERRLTMDKLEVWKDIPEFTGLYQVSSEGRVRSLDRIVFNDGNGALCNLKGKVLKPNSDRGGYLYVSLVKDKVKTKSVKIHRLVATCFCNHPEEATEVNHKNGLRHDNRAENLEWVTRSQNIRDIYKRGLNTNGERNNASKLENAHIGIIASLYDSGVSQYVIAKAFGVTQGTISNIIRNKHYKNGLIPAGLAISYKEAGL
jgi:lambda repressor-like predicted transcriptional regulator